MSQKIAIFLLVMCLSVPAFSQHHGMGMMPMRGMASDQEIDRSLDTLQRTLSLSPSQVTSIRELARSRRDSFRTIQEQARPKHEQLMAMLKQPNPDPAAVGKAVIELKTIHEQVRAKQADLEKQLTSILNPTQQQIVNNLRNQAQTFTALRRLGLLGMPESSHGT